MSEFVLKSTVAFPGLWAVPLLCNQYSVPPVITGRHVVQLAMIVVKIEVSSPLIEVHFCWPTLEQSPGGFTVTPAGRLAKGPDALQLVPDGTATPVGETYVLFIGI